MNKQINEIDSEIPETDDAERSDLKDTVGWVLNVMLKFGAGYLAKMILDALGL